MRLSMLAVLCALLPMALAECVPKRMGFMSQPPQQCPPGFYPNPEGKGCRLLILKNSTPPPAAVVELKPASEKVDHIINVPTKCPEGHQLDFRGRCRPKWGA